MSPKISVIMVAYNTEKYVTAAIESILKQSFRDFELVIVNDGSTDGTDGVIHRIKDERIHYINSNQNIGIPAARNIALDHAVGKYIAIMDSDDIAPPYRLYDQYEYMENHPEVGVLSGDVFEFGSSNRYRVSIKGNLQIKYRFFFRCPINNPAAMIRRSTIQGCGVRYDIRYEVCSDYKFWIDLLNRTEFANLGDKPYAFYRTGHSESITTDTSRADRIKRRDEVVFDIARQFLNRFNLVLSDEEYCALCPFFGYMERPLELSDYEKAVVVLEKLIEQGKGNMEREDLWEAEMRRWITKWADKI